MNAATTSLKQRWERIIYFFPIQLVFMHLKKNLSLMIFWVILFAYITQNLGVKYGIPYLFLNPEYNGDVNFFSHLILGFAAGGFIMAFNISSYVINGFRFPFIATLSRPFFKYCQNNIIIPGVFVVVYCWQLADFQFATEYVSGAKVMTHISGFIIGILVNLFLGFSYFFSTNKNLLKLRNKKLQNQPKGDPDNPVSSVLGKPEKWYKVFNRDREWHVETYFNDFKIALARNSEHYDEKMLKSVFQQNHLNASLFELLVLGSILILGLFRELDYFQIPAGATVMLLFTMMFMLYSAFHSWFKGWSSIVILGLALTINYVSKYDRFVYHTYAYGLNYEGTKINYTDDLLADLAHNEDYKTQDRAHEIEALNSWKEKTSVTLDRAQKPKLILLNTSGGGLRAAMWTMHVLTYADSVLDGKLMDHTRLITGSSGGMIGAGVARELYLRSQNSPDYNPYEDKHVDQIGSDILNPVAFAIAVNDLFVRWQNFDDGQYQYTKDRAYAFEQALFKNTGSILDKRLGEYYEPVHNAQIPQMVLSPISTTDARKFLISSQPISYLTDNLPLDNVTNIPVCESAEFQRMFATQDADQLRFLSALRMSATFPYILPNTTLPTNPEIEVMDAGVRDNFGLVLSIKYLEAFKDWIAEETSGVIIVQIRDKAKHFETVVDKQTKLNTIMSPIGSFYNNWPKVQTYEQDEILRYAGHWFDSRIDLVSFEMALAQGNQVSLSWHLTSKEKSKIKSAILLESNQTALQQLRTLLHPEQ